MVVAERECTSFTMSLVDETFSLADLFVTLHNSKGIGDVETHTAHKFTAVL